MENNSLEMYPYFSRSLIILEARLIPMPGSERNSESEALSKSI